MTQGAPPAWCGQHASGLQPAAHRRAAGWRHHGRAIPAGCVHRVPWRHGRRVTPAAVPRRRHFAPQVTSSRHSSCATSWCAPRRAAPMTPPRGPGRASQRSQAAAPPVCGLRERAHRVELFCPAASACRSPPSRASPAFPDTPPPRVPSHDCRMSMPRTARTAAWRHQGSTASRWSHPRSSGTSRWARSVTGRARCQAAMADRRGGRCAGPAAARLPRQQTVARRRSRSQSRSRRRRRHPRRALRRRPANARAAPPPILPRASPPHTHTLTRVPPPRCPWACLAASL